MNAKRVFFGMVGLLVLLVGVGFASLVLGNQILQKKSAKLVNLKLQSHVLDSQQVALSQAKKDVTKYTPLNTIAQTIVPQDKDQALTVREIVDFANQSSIKIGSIAFPASNLGVVKLNSTSSSSSSGASAATKPSLSQLSPVVGISGIYQMPITINGDTSNPITFSQLTGFLQLLENNRHTAQVSQLTITPADTSGKLLSFEIIINVYIKP